MYQLGGDGSEHDPGSEVLAGSFNDLGWRRHERPDAPCDVQPLRCSISEYRLGGFGPPIIVTTGTDANIIERKKLQLLDLGSMEAEIPMTSQFFSVRELGAGVANSIVPIVLPCPCCV